MIWSLDSDMGPDQDGTFLYAGWDTEIAALRATGAASCDFLRGWTWHTLSSMLAPWVDQLADLRQQAEDDAQPDVAQLVKLVANAAIGRWGMSPEQYALVPDEEHDLSLGDMPLESGDAQLTGAWIRKTADISQHALPTHWSSYVRMVVRMETWRKAIEVLHAGGTILLTNFDAVWVAGEPQATNSVSTFLAQQEHPWVWRPKRRYQVVVRGPRSIVWEDENGVQLTLPGISGAMRMAILVDAQRRRLDRLNASTSVLQEESP